MNHVASLVAFILSIILVFTAILMLISLHNKQEARRRCMMNRPAGSRARIAHSPTGQTNPTSIRREREKLIVGSMYGKFSESEISHVLDSDCSFPGYYRSKD